MDKKSLGQAYGLRRQASKKMNKGGMCYSKGGMVEDEANGMEHMMDADAVADAILAKRRMLDRSEDQQELVTQDSDLDDDMRLPEASLSDLGEESEEDDPVSKKKKILSAAMAKWRLG